jgi:hypothetical protein
LSPGSSSALGVTPQGATDLHSYLNLLTNCQPPGTNLVAAALQLPAGAADTDSWRRQQLADERSGAAAASATSQLRNLALDPSRQQAVAAASGQGATAYQLSTRRHMAVLTPGPSPLLKLDPTSSLAESIVLRGARRAGGGACPQQAAAAALDAALVSEPQRRCVVHRCVVGAPLSVPLPFPGLFSSWVGREGDVVASWSPGAAAAGATAAAVSSSGDVQTAATALAGGGGGGPATSTAAAAESGASPDGRHVVSCPVLTRVVATSEFKGWLQSQSTAFTRAACSAAGRATADCWGVGSGEVEEIGERLEQLAASYSDTESGDEFD